MDGTYMKRWHLTQPEPDKLMAILLDIFNTILKREMRLSSALRSQALHKDMRSGTFQ